MNRAFEFVIPPKCGLTRGSDDGSAERVTLVGITSGIAAGRLLRVKGNAQLEWWSLFTTLDQLDTCLAGDSLQLQHPALFAQVKREFEHVNRQPCAVRVDSRPRTSTGLCGAGP